MDRRDFLSSTGLALAGFGLAPGALRAAAQANPKPGTVFVLVIQRGAADGLAMLPPVADPRYRELRPGLALPEAGEGAALRLDGLFGLHPALRALKPFWDDGLLLGVHAVGSPDPTRSHFDAQDFLESGTPGRKSTEDGFLDRALPGLPTPKGTAATFRAVALQTALPRCLQGHGGALALASLDDFQLPKGGAGKGFEDMYGAALDATLRGTGKDAFEALQRLQDQDPRKFLPQNGAVYPNSPLGRRMQEIARLVKADLGLRIAVTDCGGWDTHAAQGAATGQLANRLQDFGDSLGAFLTDLTQRLDQVCLMTVTEFGRTVRENGTRGTDHGHGSCLFVAGGAVKGKRVLARWKGLDLAQLHEGRDLPVTTDYREVAGELLRRHLQVKDLGAVFPGYKAPAELGLLRG